MGDITGLYMNDDEGQIAVRGWAGRQRAPLGCSTPLRPASVIRLPQLSLPLTRPAPPPPSRSRPCRRWTCRPSLSMASRVRSRSSTSCAPPLSGTASCASWSATPRTRASASRRAEVGPAEAPPPSPQPCSGHFFAASQPARPAQRGASEARSSRHEWTARALPPETVSCRLLHPGAPPPHFHLMYVFLLHCFPCSTIRCKWYSEVSQLGKKARHHISGFIQLVCRNKVANYNVHTRESSRRRGLQLRQQQSTAHCRQPRDARQQRRRESCRDTACLPLRTGSLHHTASSSNSNIQQHQHSRMK